MDDPNKPQPEEYGNLVFTVDLPGHFYVGDAIVQLVRPMPNGKIRIRVTAPKSTRIDRAVVRERMDNDNQS